MARNKSAMKYLRQSEKTRLANRARKSMIRTFSKKAIASAEAGDFDAAGKYQKVAVSLIDRAAQRSTLHKNTAARRKSRLSRNIKSFQAQA